ncbi:MAG: NfeD family protein [Oscillospiraceae bacterium]|nr:NfeD family protein [Oscillospiraceae bacterium]
MVWAAVLWFVLIVVFLAIESSTVSLVSIWFAAGSLAAMVTAILGGEIWLQVVLFVAVSVLLLASLRPVVRKYITPKLVKTNVDAVIGKTGPVLEAIDNVQGTGRVKLSGMEWSARSTENEPIEEGMIVKVDRVEGVKVFVTPADK